MRQLLGQLFLEVIMSLTYPFTGILSFFIPDTYISKSHSTHRPIVLVQRWMSQNIFHLYWIRYLEKRGFAVYSLYLPLYKGSFESSAYQLKNFIEEHKLEDITLVGISSGGITARLYTDDLQGWNRVRYFISVATPFYGTPLIFPLYLIKPCRELLPTSDFMKNFSTRPVIHKEKSICVIPKFDEMVPLTSQYLPGAKKEIVTIYGHNNLHLYKKRTYDVVASYARLAGNNKG